MVDETCYSLNDLNITKLFYSEVMQAFHHHVHAVSLDKHTNSILLVSHIDRLTDEINTCITMF